MKTALLLSLVAVALPALLTSPAAAAEPSSGTESAPVADVAQASPLGLVYLTDPRGFLVYAYRQSDSSPLAEGELHFLDAEKQPLGACSVKDGLALGQLPAGTHYLQLRCGDDTLTAEVQDRIVRPHPDAPKARARMTRDFRFLDRRTYHPGDTVRLAGVRRDMRDGVLYYPENTRLVLLYTLPGEEGHVQHEQEVTIGADGTWLAEFTLPQDMQGMKRVSVYEKLGDRGQMSLFATVDIEEEPTPSIRMEGSLEVQGRQVESCIRATTADGKPLTGQNLRWSLEGMAGMVMPEGYEDYFFGDGRPFWREAHRRRIPEHFVFGCTAELDEHGTSQASFTLPLDDFPKRMVLTLSANLGYGRTPGGITHRERVVMEPAELCVGLRRTSAYSKPGEELLIDLALVRSSGLRCEDAPVEVELLARHHEFLPEWTGEQLHDSWRSREVHREKLQLPSEGTSLSLRLEEEGAYDIIVHGYDAAGNEFATAVRQYVWAGERAPWLTDVSGRVRLTTKQGDYGSLCRPGETVELFCPSLMEGTAIIVIEGEKERYVLTRRVLAGQRSISFPMLEEYGAAPSVTLAVVQGAGPRPMHGHPMLQLGEVSLTAQPAVPPLAVQLAESPSDMKPGEQWDVEGSVRDAQGRPVAGATVLLCARDVGATEQFNGARPATLILQDKGRGFVNRLFMDAGDVPSLPDPRSQFTWLRQERFSSSFNYAGGVETLPDRRHEFTELAIFGANTHRPEPYALRGSATLSGSTAGDGVTVATLWTRVSTDEQGRFLARFTAPNERTEIQLCALACGQPEQFGVAGVLIPICPAADESELEVE